jgi:peptidoglycan glycosyltransferase
LTGHISRRFAATAITLADALSPTTPKTARRRRLLLRAAPLAILAAAAFAAGALVAGGSDERDAVARFAEAWSGQDFATMHQELTPEAQAEHPLEDFERSYRKAARTATLDQIVAGEPRGPLDQDGSRVVAVPIEAQTRSFGTITGELAVPVADGRIEWSPSLSFPGLRPGESLTRRTRAPERAPILYADRSPLARGPATQRTTVGAGGVVAGEIGRPPAERAQQMRRQGFPEGTPAGMNGLELAFDEDLAGIPGGRLLTMGGGATRTIAAADPTPGKPLRTTLDPTLQEATVAALGGSFGGVAVLDARNGEVRALAGIAFSAPQPPGSTFKIVTTVGALEAGLTDLDETYPVVASTPVAGREIDNADDAACGGTLVQSFANSCNTVFAPLGAELGPERLLETAERFGFNSPPTLYNEEGLAATRPPSSRIPPISDDLEAAVTAIGQGRVLATPLQMASVAQTIAAQGTRSPTSLVKNPDLAHDSEPVKVTSPEIADQVRDMMVEVVRSGTGKAAALPNTAVAGKSGTAELGPAADQDLAPGEEPEQDVNAWFAAFAPAKRPRLAVAVMIVNAEADGGVVAAPIAREVLTAGLGGGPA